MDLRILLETFYLLILKLKKDIDNKLVNHLEILKCTLWNNSCSTDKGYDTIFSTTFPAKVLIFHVYIQL